MHGVWRDGMNYAGINFSMIGGKTDALFWILFYFLPMSPLHIDLNTDFKDSKIIIFSISAPNGKPRLGFKT